MLRPESVQLQAEQLLHFYLALTTRSNLFFESQQSSGKFPPAVNERAAINVRFDAANGSFFDFVPTFSPRSIFFYDYFFMSH